MIVRCIQFIMELSGVTSLVSWRPDDDVTGEPERITRTCWAPCLFFFCFLNWNKGCFSTLRAAERRNVKPCHSSDLHETSVTDVNETSHVSKLYMLQVNYINTDSSYLRNHLSAQWPQHILRSSNKLLVNKLWYISRNPAAGFIYLIKVICEIQLKSQQS